MLKQELRKIYKNKRNELSVSQKEKMTDMMLIQFQQLNIEIPSVVMSYAPIEKLNEFDPSLIEEYCRFKNPQIAFAYSVMEEEDKNAELTIKLVNDQTQFKENHYGIYEPQSGIEIAAEHIDLVITPLLCFDSNGNRIGYGKGYYDHFLKNCRHDCIKIGFSFFKPVGVIDDINEFDIPMDYCITPETIYTFTK